jgi:hypothetical protein
VNTYFAGECCDCLFAVPLSIPNPDTKVSMYASSPCKAASRYRLPRTTAYDWLHDNLISDVCVCVCVCVCCVLCVCVCVSLGHLRRGVIPVPLTKNSISMPYVRGSIPNILGTPILFYPRLSFNNDRVIHQ